MRTLPRYEHRLVEKRMVWSVSLASDGNHKVTGEEVCQRWWREEGGLLGLAEFWRERDGRKIIAKRRFVGGGGGSGGVEDLGGTRTVGWCGGGFEEA